MSIVTLIEGQAEPPDTWMKLLGLAPDSYNELRTTGILEPVRDGSGMRQALRYVGFIGLRDRLVVSLPKFGLDDPDPIGWLRRVLATYFGRAGRTPVGEPLTDLHFRDETLFREIDALATLVRLFEDRGLYARRAVIVSSHPTGPIDWPRTIGSTAPVFVAGSAFYPQPLYNRRLSEANEVSLIQAAVTATLLRKYDMPPRAGIDSAISSISLSDYLGPVNLGMHLATIQRERVRTFAADDLLLLDVLESVLRDLAGMAGPPGLVLHGTRAFYAIWEDALRELLQGGASEHVLAQPIWRDWVDHAWSPPRGAGEHAIDLLVKRPGDRVILDAKYYYPYPAARPGWADIVKQLYYAETMVTDEGEVLGNGFLVPGPGAGDVGLVGRVEVLGGARKFPVIEAWQVDPRWVFSSYGDSNEVRSAAARATFFRARDEMAEVLSDADALISLESGNGDASTPGHLGTAAH